MKTLRTLAFTLAVLVPMSLSPAAFAANALPGVGQVAYDEDANTLTLAVPFKGHNPFRVLWLNGPKRLVVDVEGLLVPNKRSLYIGGGVVTQIRAGRFNRTTTRVVFDLAQPADLRAVTDGATNQLLLTVYPRGAQPVAGAPSGLVVEPGELETPTPAATPKPRATAKPKPIAAKPSPKPTAKPTVKPTPIAVVPSEPVPQGRITPIPVIPPSEEPVAPPSLAPTPMPEPTFEPAPVPEETPEPLPTPEAVVESEFAVFGSRLTVGSEMAMSLTETYPAGASASSVSSLIPNGVFAWDQMFTPNFGISLSGRAMSYTLEDKANTEAGVQTQHKRDDLEGALALRGRLPLPLGFELMAQPGFMLRKVSVSSTEATADANGNFPAGTPLTLDQFLYSGYMGYGPTVQAGLGWHVYGPFSLAGTFDYNYLLAGSMDRAGVSTVIPLSGMRYGGEARLDFGWLGLSAGYNMTNWNHAGADATSTLSQSWGGPYVKASIVY